MVVTCAFYGFTNRTTKVTLQVDCEELEVGREITFEGDQYVILSVSSVSDDLRANVVPAHLQRFHVPPRVKAAVPRTPRTISQESIPAEEPRQDDILQARLRAAEARLETMRRERDDALMRLDQAIQQLGRLQHMEVT
jgi:hypothetical protein